MISPYLIEAVYFLFAEMPFLNKDGLLLLIFLLFLRPLFRRFSEGSMARGFQGS